MDERPDTDELLNRVRRGEAASIGPLFERFRPRLGRMVALRLDQRVSPRVSASDVLQDVFLDVAAQMQRYLRNPRVTLYVWMHGLARQRLQKVHREHLAAARRTARREIHLPADSSVALARQLLSREPSPSQALTRREMRRRVQGAIGRLKPEDREVILMREFEGLSNAEVAEALELSRSAATMRYGRALARLKDALVAELSSGDRLP